MTQWTDELKQEIIKDYQDSEPTAKTSPEIVSQIAENHDLSANGVRLVLMQAGVYIKKEVAAGKAAGKDAASGTKRVSKESSIAELKEAIKEKGAEVDDAILDKLTGKAAVYFTSVLKTQ